MSGLLPTHSSPPFASEEEFRGVMEEMLELMRKDPSMGPRLRAADTPECFSFSDLGLRLAVRAGRAGEPNLIWAWGEEIDWEPRVTLTMTSEVAHRFFQGRENVAVAVARRRIEVEGDLRAAVALLPLIRPVFGRYRQMLEEEYPHLALPD